MRTLPVAHFAAHASRVIKEVQGGDRITITVRGEPVAVMVPAAGFVEAVGTVGEIVDDRRCRYCRFWEADDSDALSGVCESPKVAEFGETSSARYDRLCPGPDFGCVHWEARRDGG